MMQGDILEINVTYFTSYLYFPTQWSRLSSISYQIKAENAALIAILTGIFHYIHIQIFTFVCDPSAAALAPLIVKECRTGPEKAALSSK